VERARDVLAQITGVNCSIGAVSQAHGKVAQALAMPVQQATAALAQAQVLHVDETRYPRDGTNGNWVWWRPRWRSWTSCLRGLAT